jgi:group I intron endonuclease
MTHFVYKVTNSVNGKIYIGITYNVDKRWRKHQRNANSPAYSSRFYSAIRKHGVEYFSIEVIYCSLFRDDVMEKEIYFIREYNSIDKNYGYNMTYGGENTSSHPEIRAKISAAHKGKILSAEHKVKISASGKGRIVTSEGRKNMGNATKHSEKAIAHRKKIQDACNKIRVISTPEGIEVVHNLKKFCNDNNLSVTNARNVFAKHIKHKSETPYKQKYYCLGVL